MSTCSKHSETSKQLNTTLDENSQASRLVLEYYFLYFSSNTYGVGTQKNHLKETVPLSTQNTYSN